MRRARTPEEAVEQVQGVLWGYCEIGLVEKRYMRQTDHSTISAEAYDELIECYPDEEAKFAAIYKPYYFIKADWQ